jgi:hypothetical protein
MAILLPGRLHFSCHVRVQMCLKICMVKNFTIYEGARTIYVFNTDVT